MKARWADELRVATPESLIEEVRRTLQDYQPPVASFDK